MNTLHHDRENTKYVLTLENKEEAWVKYDMRDNVMYLTYASVPSNWQGKGIGKELVIKTFEKLTVEGYKAVAICSYVRAVKNRSDKWKEVIG